jgi:hypothetical protein
MGEFVATPFGSFAEGDARSRALGREHNRPSVVSR